MGFLKKQLLAIDFPENYETDSFFNKILNAKNLVKIIQGVNSTSINYKEFNQLVYFK
jgi:hypothetical protein